jgi:transcription termination/antitermination protein NusG
MSDIDTTTEDTTTEDTPDEITPVEEVIDAEDLLDEEAEAAPPFVSPYDRPGRWYVVHTQSG